MNGGEVEETVVHADLRRDACEFARPVCDVISLLATRKTKMRLMSFGDAHLLGRPHLPNRAGLQTSDSWSE
jgi:hypothetical protein